MGNYIVTGAAGFIGARVSEMLLDAGHQVTGIDNLNDAYDVRIKEWRLERIQRRQGFDFQRLDISDWSLVQSLQNEPYDAIIHLAARAGVRAAAENPWIYINTNVNGSLNLLELARQRNISKFILASTSSIYGADPPYPTPEEADSSRPLQQYAASKKGAEALAHSYHHLYGLDISVLRFFTVYGPAGRPDLAMFRFVQWISEGRPVRVTGDGHQSRGFTYIDDIARGILLALKPVGYEVINLGGHETIEIIDLVHMIERMLGRQAQVTYIPFNSADMLANWAKVEKAGRLLGWEPQVSLEEGVSRLVAWYQAERSWASQIDTSE